MKIAFKTNTVARLSLLFGLIWLAVGAAGVFGWRSVSAEVGQRAQAEAGFAVDSVSESLNEAGRRYGAQARSEVRALRAAAERLGPARIDQGSGITTLRFGEAPQPKSLAEDVASRSAGVATIFFSERGELIAADSSQENAAGAIAPGSRIGAGTGLPALVKAGQSAAEPTRLGGRVYYVYLEPITDPRGAVIGAYGASFPLEAVDEVAREVAGSPVFAHGFLVVVDGRDDILFSSKGAVPPWLSKHMNTLNQGGDLQGGILDGYNINRSAPGDGGLRVIAGVSQSDLTLSTLKLVGASVMFVGIVVVVALTLGWLLARRLTKALADAELHRAEAEQARAQAEKAGKALNVELEQAARYVTSLLPARTHQGHVTADWLYVPSERLGGDAFGYHWLDDSRFTFYLLDVCGHGVGAALLATTAMNVIRAQTVNADFTDPSSVLRALNIAFPMEQQDGMYFTIWYGVYDVRTQKVKYAGAGHHPAVLMLPGSKPILLSGKGPPIGCFEGVKFPTSEAQTSPGAQLYVFSDGLFEVELKACTDMMSFDEFVQVIADWHDVGEDRKLDGVVERIQDIQGKPNFDDDCSLMELSFRPAARVRLVA
ncbi:MAG TPA: SpoIIE family protein phosphatase [Caulobacteraceae bacterium]